MGDYITCFEQNKEDPTGFRDPLWTDSSSTECQNNPELCESYQKDEPNPNQGDVCDHRDPRTKATRNSCYFNVIYGEEIDTERTWSYKCWSESLCPLQDENGIGIQGCKVTDKRITCCCNDADFCNGQELFLKYAEWGRPDHYPPDIDEILSYDNGDVKVEYIPDPVPIRKGDAAKHNGLFNIDQQANPSDGYNFSNYNVNVADIFLIFTYFVLGILCLGIGVVIGSKWKTKVIYNDKENNQIDI